MKQKILGIQGWMSEEELDFLWKMVARADPRATIVELGTWKGRSTAALYSAMHNQQTVITVDTWLGQKDLRYTSHAEILERDVFLDFMAVMKDLYIPVSWYNIGDIGPCYLRMESVDAVTLFDDGKIDILFIDCDHNKVGEDIDLWKDKIKSGGIICGHDWNWPGVKEQILDRFPIQKVVADIWVGVNNG